MKRMLIGGAAGFFAGMLSVVFVQLISNFLYPFPEELALDDSEGIKAHFETLPVPAFLIVLVSHFLGPFVGTLVACCWKPDSWKGYCAFFGIFFLLSGILNLVSVPHPQWFAIVDLLLYLPAAFLGAMVSLKLSTPDSASNSSETMST